jgi:Plavaka transposase
MPSSNAHNFSSVAEQSFCTPRNIFGLFRKYCSEKPPSHDPEEHIDLHGLSDDIPTIATPTSSQPSRNGAPFYPYPNESSFQLGEWYWNNGVQKSRESFNSLVAIVGNPQFRPEDVHNTNWKMVDATLAANDFDGEMGLNDDGWMDEKDADAGWRRTPVSISVPFHNRAKQPGPQNLLVGDLYHRPLVSIIREKLANVQDMQHFHLEPFELFWRPSTAASSVRVHGELYTSPEFVEAHRELQNSHREPGCNLPRVVVALMFWSDATQLTSYGTAQLWPCYLCFGNESKYRRCKPTHHLCNHIAYFQAVRLHFC